MYYRDILNKATAYQKVINDLDMLKDKYAMAINPEAVAIVEQASDTIRKEYDEFIDIETKD
jgi:hypothetical protein